MPTIDQLESFLALLQHGTTTEAARARNCAASTISTHLGKLEKFVGVALVRRANGSFSPTEAGARLREPAQAITDAYATIRSLQRPARTLVPRWHP